MTSSTTRRKSSRATKSRIAPSGAISTRRGGPAFRARMALTMKLEKAVSPTASSPITLNRRSAHSRSYAQARGFVEGGSLRGEFGGAVGVDRRAGIGFAPRRGIRRAAVLRGRTQQDQAGARRRLADRLSQVGRRHDIVGIEVAKQATRAAGGVDHDIWPHRAQHTRDGGLVAKVEYPSVRKMRRWTPGRADRLHIAAGGKPPMDGAAQESAGAGDEDAHQAGRNRAGLASKSRVAAS